jgi:hypothetical protein
MEFLLTGIAAIGVVIGALYFQSALEIRRKARLKNLQLIENCLLTRHPIAFISPERGLFHRTSHWHEIPQFLREHGYDIFEIELPPIKHNQLSATLASLNDFSIACHLIADSSQEELLTQLANSKCAHLCSLTMVRNRDSSIQLNHHSTKNLTAMDLKPFNLPITNFVVEAQNSMDWISRLSTYFICVHNLVSRRHLPPIDPVETGAIIANSHQQPWKIETRFLELAISLAEFDLQCSD